MILDEWVEVKWSKPNILHYTNLGYKFTKYRDKIKVKVSDLPNNANVRVRFKCDTCGRDHTLTWAKYTKRKDKTTCAKCCTSATKNIEFVREEFNKRGYDLITDFYVNAHQHLEYRCRKHPEIIQRIIYNSLQRGCGCKLCGLECRGAKRRLTLEQVTSVVKQAGYIFVGIYPNDSDLNSKTYIKYICPNHPQFIQKMRYNNLQQGFRCPICYSERKKFKFIPNKLSTPIKEYFRPHMIEWKNLSEELSGNRCILTGSTNYDVHHHIPFNRILNEALSNLNLPKFKHASEYTTEQIENVIAELKTLHVRYGPGVCLAGHLHKLLHSQYSYRREITKDEFNQFCLDYKLGKIMEVNPDYHIDFS